LITWRQSPGTKAGVSLTKEAVWLVHVIGSVERGERNVAILNLRAIAHVLRVSLAELLAEKPEEGEGMQT
jgi:hypothetical protein